MSHVIVNRMPWSDTDERDPQVLLGREWLVTNGLGGYASGTISGACTRRYHGLLIAALSAPWGRLMMLNHLAEEIRYPDDSVIGLGGEERADGTYEHNSSSLVEFRLESGLPVWVYQVGEYQLEKRVVLPYLQNTVHINYRLMTGPSPLHLRLRPSVHFRSHDGRVSEEFTYPYTVIGWSDRFELAAGETPPLRFHLDGPSAALVLDGGRYREVFYRIEQSRGYDARGGLWSPGYFRGRLAKGEELTLVASTEAWDTILANPHAVTLQAELQRRDRLIQQARPEARHGLGAELILAADQFIITPTTRVADTARAHATGDEVRTIIAGYHWFTDWGRDTMICLEGLTLVTGRQSEAGYILRTFGRAVRNGLIPNMFPEGQHEGLYHTADATLWYFHALDRYLKYTGDRQTLEVLLPVLRSIVDFHMRGTDFGIGVDPADGLLKQGAPGYQLTWMDAKVGDWVVTPRRGKAVEINALWYNALRLMENWTNEFGDPDESIALSLAAVRVRDSFNRRFWYPVGGYLFDVVDGEQGDDPALRPNQLFALSLAHPVLDPQYWNVVLEKVVSTLLTPMGLRTLAPGDPDYKARYDGDLRSRDAAYHQGTVWPWLIGPFVDAWLRVHPDDISTARSFLAGFECHLGEACLGSISEIFDAEAPYTPRGCIAQGWSIAEVLRCWAKTTHEGG